MKRILILGSNGYLGCPLMRFLEEKGYEVAGLDNNLRKRNVESVGGKSLTKVEKHPNTMAHDISKDALATKILVKDLQPDAIVHLAEQPSAPFSMISAQRAAETQRNNVVGTMNVLWAIREVNPEIHLIKLGTAGEYSDWIWDKRQIPESPRIKLDGWEIPTPRYAGSFYHFSKLFDSFNIDYACRIWGLRATDINQGVVYGHLPGTRFDYDEWFGTVVNRFAAQAVVGMPLTVYGTGGQERGFISIRNVMEAIELVIENPPEGYEIIHQLTEVWSVRNIAKLVQKLTGCEIQEIENPRAEMNKNRFTFEAKKLLKYGLKTISMLEELPRLLDTVREHKEGIIKSVIMPETKWS